MSKHMYSHLTSIMELHGKDAYVQIPNGIFRDLSTNIKSFQQISFAYSYLVLNAFLYKYAHYVDINNKTYIQSRDAKQILGYNAGTKSINYLIKKGGLLDSINLTESSKNYPILMNYSEEKINNTKMIDHVMLNDMIDTDYHRTLKSVVKNYNFEVKIPLFLFEYQDDVGTLYNYGKTHKVYLNEFIDIIYDDKLKTIGFLLYMYFKSKCYGYKQNKNKISLDTIRKDTGICRDTLYEYMNRLKENNYLEVKHRGWRSNNYGRTESNEYTFRGVRNIMV